MQGDRRDTRILILGGAGMLGHQLVETLSQSHDTWATLRGPVERYAPWVAFDPDRTLVGVDARRWDSVEAALDRARPTVVVNAIGVVKQVPEGRDPVTTLEVNGVFPHRLAAACAARGARLVHISTDCVYAGTRGGYRESDPPDATDLYGRSKLVGEPEGPGCLVLRTSMIGRELGTRHGLLEWLIANDGGAVRGFTRAVFSGLPTATLARFVGTLIERHPTLEGTYHVGSEPITKHDLLVLLADALGLSVRIDPVDEPVVDRSLDSSAIAKRTGYAVPRWQDLAKLFAEERRGPDRGRQGRK